MKELVKKCEQISKNKIKKQKEQASQSRIQNSFIR